MGKHSKNNCARPIFTPYERSLTKYGTQKQRLGHDSLNPFGYCALTLQPFVNPVADKQGYTYSKQSIYEYLLEQKKQYKSKLKEYERQQMKIKVC